jgi:hypothetical protein
VNPATEKVCKSEQNSIAVGKIVWQNMAVSVWLKPMPQGLKGMSSLWNLLGASIAVGESVRAAILLQTLRAMLLRASQRSVR